QSKLVKYFSRQLSCKRKVALQERNAKLEGFPQLLHWFRIVDIRKEVMEEIAPGQLSLEELLDMTDDQVCATVEKFGANSEECARLNASLSCLRSVHKSGGSLSKQDWTIQWPTTEPGKENSPGCQAEPGQWARTHLSQSPKVQPKCGQHHCHGGSSHAPLYTHVDRLTVEAHPGLCPPLESGHRSLPPSPRQRHAAHTPPRTPNIVTTMTPPGTPPVRRRNKLKPPGTPPPSSRKLIHLIPGFTALHRSKSHEFQLGHRVDEAHTPNQTLPKTNKLNKVSCSPSPEHPLYPQNHGIVQAGKHPPALPRPLLTQVPKCHMHITPGMGTPPLPWAVVPGLNNPFHEGIFPDIQPKPPLLQLPLLLSLVSWKQNLALPVWLPPPVRQLQSQKVPPEPPFLQAEPPQLPQLLLLLQPLPQLHSLPCTCSSPSVSFLSHGHGSRWGISQPSGSAWIKPCRCPHVSPGTSTAMASGRWALIHVMFLISSFPSCLTALPTLFQNEEGPEEVQESEDDFEEMNLSLLSARNLPRKASQTSIFLQEWDIPFEQLEIGELIGKGRFGQVFHGRWHGEVAIRLIDIERDNEDQLKAFKREVMAYRQTRHENVVLFMGACMSPPHLAIITSLCKGRTLYSVVRDAKIVLDVNKTRQIAQEIVKGMGYLHAKGILHKDLKSKNVFYDNGKVVITDFGLFSISGVLQAGRRENKLRIQNGWLCHLAPEIIRQLSPDAEEDKLPFSKHSDVFALGTIWYELHAREWPFKTQPAEAIIWQVGRGMKPNLSQIGMGKEISDILLFCWAYEQEERPTFTKLMDILEKLPKRNRRLSHPGHFWKSAE
ncbi:KSR2 Kinase, partial [Mionectes macconnelli]|nr:KSR2 Kinase [Mionectes macconnelli]